MKICLEMTLTETKIFTSDQSNAIVVKTVHHAEQHPKEARYKQAMKKKHRPEQTVISSNTIPYQDESKKIVDSIPMNMKQPIHELKRMQYSPSRCNCCWSKDNKWYRRHNQVLKKKGDNKDNKSGHWTRHLLIRPPSFVSKYAIRQEVATALSDYDLE